MPYDSLATKKQALKGIRDYSKSALADELKGVKEGGADVGMLQEASEAALDVEGAPEVPLDGDVGVDAPAAVEVEKVSVAPAGPVEDDVAEGVEDPQAQAAFAGVDEPAVPGAEDELDISTLSPEIIKKLLAGA